MRNLFILLIFIILSQSYCFSQLSIRNSAYIYSDDTVIFVEDNLNIEETTANIYLRNGAQLMQGAGTTGNSGEGKLSVYQNTTVDNFAYNYWCSPVGNVDMNTNSNRQFRADSNLYDHIGNANQSLDPITSELATYTDLYDGTSSPLVISNRWLYTYNPGVEHNEWDYIGTTGTVDAGYGFTMKGTTGSSNNQLYDFRGKPNNGEISNAVNFEEYTLVGNPYPSALDIRDYIWDTDNSTIIDANLYFWEQDLSTNSHFIADYVGGYASYTITEDGTLQTFNAAPFNTYTSSGMINTIGSASTSGKSVKRYLPIGQGFMVFGVANGVVLTKNAHREYIKEGVDSEFFRQADSGSKTNSDVDTEARIEYNEEGFSIIPEAYKRFRINIDFNEVYTRQLVHNFHDSATDFYDRGLESIALTISNDGYWTSNEKNYVAQANNYNEELKIPLTINISESQPLLRFRLLDVQNFDETQPIYLHDIESGVYYDLKNQDVEVNNLETGNYTNRFEITFINSNAVLNVYENTADKLQIFQNNPASELTLINKNNLDLKELNLYDVTGKLIFKQTDFSNQTNRHTVNTNQISTGVYFVNVKLESSNLIITEKVLIEN